MRSLLATSIVLAMLLAAADGFARNKRVDQIPNGSTYSCGTCHVSSLGGGPRNAFGQQVEANLTQPGSAGDVQWGQIYNLDADGDGYTNGEELGDPNGNWSIGDPDPAGMTSRPADASDTLCGNGNIEGPEACDGNNLNGSTCSDQGFAGGTLACDSSCNYDTSGCFTAMDTGVDAGMDGGMDGGIDMDAGPDVIEMDTGMDTGIDSGMDVGMGGGDDAGQDTGMDSGLDAGTDMGIDAGDDAGEDTGTDAGQDAGMDAGMDTGGQDDDPVDASESACASTTSVPGAPLWILCLFLYIGFNRRTKRTRAD
jgi:hypothetical protein